MGLNIVVAMTTVLEVHFMFFIWLINISNLLLIVGLSVQLKGKLHTKILPLILSYNST